MNYKTQKGMIRMKIQRSLFSSLIQFQMARNFHRNRCYFCIKILLLLLTGVKEMQT